MVLACIASQSCVVFNRPRGAWADPVKLDLHDKSLKELVVALECEAGDFEGGKTERAIINSCRDIVALIKSMGATVEADEALLPQPTLTDDETATAAEAINPDDLPPPDLKLTYIDRDYRNDWCGWTLPLFILSWTLFPCVVDSSHRAEILIHSRQGQLLDQRELLADGKAFYGIGALPVLAAKYSKQLTRKTRYERDLAKNLYDYVRAAVHTAHMRQVAHQRSKLPPPTSTEGGGKT